jgi:hypothetical protein
MSQYSTAADFDDRPKGPSRVSILAILALVLGIVCLIPGAGVLGVFVGIAALLGIASSSGRVSGRGIAVTGIILGLLSSTVWILGLLLVQGGTRLFVTTFVQPSAAVITNIDAQKWVEVRAALDPNTSDAVSDERLAAFREEYQEELGSFVSVPTGLFDLASGYVDVGPIMQQYQNPADFVPFPAKFSKGPALVLYYFDPSQPPATRRGTPMAKNLVIVTKGGKKFELYLGTPPNPTPTPAPAPAPESPAPESPAPPPTPTPDAGGDAKPGVKLP